MKIGVLALQGAFLEHEKMLDEIGIKSFEIRQKSDLEIPMDGLILPGGESTVMGKLLKEFDMLPKLRQMIIDGLPVLATCAGLILLAESIEEETQVHIATMPITVKRNAYGRQLGSFQTNGNVKGIGEVPMKFIRAPYVIKADANVEVLATVKEHMVGVKYKNQIGLSFHPELTTDKKIHKAFMKLCEAK